MVNEFFGKNGKFLLLGLTGLLFVLPSCITTQEDILYLNDQVRRLDAKVNGLEKSMDQKVSSQLDSIRANQADTGAEIDKIKNELQALSGRVEDNREIVRRAVERDTTEQDLAKAQVVKLTKRVNDLEERLKRVYAYLGIESGGGAAAQIKAPGKPSVQLPEKGKGLSEKDLYDATLSLYKEGKYEEAATGFKNFIKKYPRSDLADNAQFWIGECHMSLKQYEQAILAYQMVIKKYSKGNKVPNAMLRQALAFYEIKDKTSAKLLLKRIIKKYPNSNEAKIAKVKLKTIR